MRLFDATTAHYYYFNKDDKTSSWYPPLGFVAESPPPAVPVLVPGGGQSGPFRHAVHATFPRSEPYPATMLRKDRRGRIKDRSKDPLDPYVVRLSFFIWSFRVTDDPVGWIRLRIPMRHDKRGGMTVTRVIPLPPRRPTLPPLVLFFRHGLTQVPVQCFA